MPWRLEKKAERIGKYYDRSQPRKCCSSLSLRNRNRKCWIWNLYFRCSSHCRVYRINWYNTKKLVKSLVGQYYDRSQPCECCSSLSFRGRNRKCWIWNYFRCSHCRVYRINWYNNAKKNLVKLQLLANIMIDPKLSSLRGGNRKCWIWNSYFQCSCQATADTTE